MDGTLTPWKMQEVELATERRHEHLLLKCATRRGPPTADRYGARPARGTLDVDRVDVEVRIPGSVDSEREVSRVSCDSGLRPQRGTSQVDADLMSATQD